MKKVLLVVDDPEIWEFMSFYLGMQGCKVYRSGRIDDIPETCGRLKPDLVVIDNSISRVMDLEAFYPSLVAESLLQDVKLLVLCNKVDYERITPVMRSADAFITRPVRPKMLLIIVRDIISNERPEWIKFLRSGTCVDPHKL